MADVQVVRFGRPISLTPDVRARIVSERDAAKSLAAVAAALNADGVATGQGGRQWWPSTVRAVLHAT